MAQQDKITTIDLIRAILARNRAALAFGSLAAVVLGTSLALLVAARLPVTAVQTELAASPSAAQSVSWPAFGPERSLPRLDGLTDALPDFVGPLDGSAELTIFTEGNHYPVLLEKDIATKGPQGIDCLAEAKPGKATYRSICQQRHRLKIVQHVVRKIQGRAMHTCVFQ